MFSNSRAAISFFKSGWASSNVVGIIYPSPLVGIGLTETPNSGWDKANPARPLTATLKGPLIHGFLFPGSGNTWARYLIQQASGYATGCIYNDGALKKGT